MMISSSPNAAKQAQDLGSQKRLEAHVREPATPTSSALNRTGAAPVAGSAPVAEPAPVSGKTAGDEALEQAKALKEINHNLKLASIGLQFEFDKDANQMITKVIDVASGDVIRRIPSEEVIRMSKAIGDLQDKMMTQNLQRQGVSSPSGLSGWLMKVSS